MATINLGFEFQQGSQVSPETLHRLVDEATITGFAPSEFSAGSIKFLTYGATRPTLARGAIHYDTTAGMEGLVYAFQSASNASVSGWLYALPRRECYCWANTAVSAGTPVFIGAPGHLVGGPEHTVFDGCVFPDVWQYSGASGPDACMFITLESVTNNKPVRCMWAGIVPDPLSVINSASGASATNPLFVDYAAGGGWRFGNPAARNFIFGVNTLPGTGRGAVIWGGLAIEDIS